MKKKESFDNHGKESKSLKDELAIVKNQLKAQIEKAINDQREIGNISEQLKLREIEYLSVSKQLKEKNDQSKLLESQKLEQKKKLDEEIASLNQEIEVLKQTKEKEKEKETSKLEVKVLKVEEKTEIVTVEPNTVPKFNPWGYFCSGISTGIIFAYFTAKFVRK